MEWAYTLYLPVFGGAGPGALLRWRLGMILSPILSALVLGPVAANLADGYLVGVAVA